MSEAIYIVGMRRVTRQTVASGELRQIPRDGFLVTSSAEIEIVDQAAAAAVIDAVRPISATGPDGFVSIGCVGFFACVLEFMQSSARDARILLLETPSAFVQDTLDLAKIGGSDGFIAQDISFVVDISRTPEPDALRIYCCEILARSRELSGTAKLASRVFKRMNEIKKELPGAEFVSFENSSEWSRRLAQSLVAVASQGGEPLSWLPSIENGHRHFMTVRPLLDLTANIELARERPLVLACLGAGGRFGIIALGPDVGDSQFDTRAAIPKDLGEIVFRAPRPEPANIPRDIRYVREEFYGHDNFYFRWTLQQEIPSHA